MNINFLANHITNTVLIGGLTIQLTDCCDAGYRTALALVIQVGQMSAAMVAADQNYVCYCSPYHQQLQVRKLICSYCNNV